MCIRDSSGRDKNQVEIVKRYAQEQGLWVSDDIVFTDTLKLDMSTVVPTISGPKRPQDKVLLTNAPISIKKVLEDKARFERELRIRKQQEALKTKSFKALKGQLPWPAEGRIISKFGRQWNSKLKTTTENPGIDIKGQPGSPIRTVLGGVVTTITYIRGYGTTIIVDHGGGFYTVYSHVTNIQTVVDGQVRNGDIIAYMGDSGSINGSKLHFEIWGKGQKLDPEKWLIKK